MPRTQRYEPRRRADTRRRGGARHRTATRYTRAVLLVTALVVTLVVAVGALTVTPPGRPAAATGPADAGTTADVWSQVAAAFGAPASRPDEESPEPAPAATPAPASTDLPATSGTGKRVVFDMSDQRVWLVGSNGAVRRTYLVSGSRSDNLVAGKYDVYSRTKHATAFDLASTMDYFVRFTKGENAAIGFHDIPVDRAGRLVQTKAELGEPLSSGCIRQQHADAQALWRFAPLGTKVVVLD